MRKLIVYAGTQILHLFHIINLETGKVFQSAEARGALNQGTPEEFIKAHTEMNEAWDKLKSEHETPAEKALPAAKQPSPPDPPAENGKKPETPAETPPELAPARK